jgi:hypothetical protein
MRGGPAAPRFVFRCARQLPGLTAADDRLVRPFRRSGDRERFVTGLRKAGLPES